MLLCVLKTIFKRCKKKHFKKSNTQFKFYFCKMLLIPFETYTMITETASLSFGPALWSGTHPFTYLHRYSRINFVFSVFPAPLSPENNNIIYCILITFNNAIQTWFFQNENKILWKNFQGYLLTKLIWCVTRYWTKYY